MAALSAARACSRGSSHARERARLRLALDRQCGRTQSSLLGGLRCLCLGFVRCRGLGIVRIGHGIRVDGVSGGRGRRRCARDRRRWRRGLLRRRGLRRVHPEGFDAEALDRVVEGGRDLVGQRVRLAELVEDLGPFGLEEAVELALELLDLAGSARRRACPSSRRTGSPPARSTGSGWYCGCLTISDSFSPRVSWSRVALSRSDANWANAASARYWARSSLSGAATLFMALVCAAEPTRETEMPMLSAGRCPALNRSVSRKIWPSVIEITLVGM